MKIDFAQILLDVWGRPMEGDDGEPATLASAVVAALLAPDKCTPIEKLRRWRLANAVVDGVDLQMDDVAEIKRLLGESAGLSIAAVGRSMDLIEKSQNRRTE